MQYTSVCYQFAVPFYFSKPQPVCSPFPLQKAISLQSFSASESHKSAVLFCFRKPQVCSPFLLQKATSLQSFSTSESHQSAVLFCFRKPEVCSFFPISLHAPFDSNTVLRLLYPYSSPPPPNHLTFILFLSLNHCIIISLFLCLHNKFQN